MSKVLAKVKDYAITEEMLNETVEALRTQQNINITSEEQKQDLLDELIARQLVPKIISRIHFPTQHWTNV